MKLVLTPKRARKMKLLPKAKRLRKQRLAYAEIGWTLGIDPMTAWRWTKDVERGDIFDGR
jgi:hypothetical protein